MKKKMAVISIVMLLLSSLVMAEEPISFGELTSEDAVYSPNNTYEKYTLFSFDFENGETAVITCSTREEENEFLFQFNYEGAPQTVVTGPDGYVFYDAGGLMGEVAGQFVEKVLGDVTWAPILMAAGDYEMTEWECQNGAKTIRGHILLPEGYEEGKLPAIIFTHGYNTNHLQVPINYAAKIVNEGYACILFDFCGGSRQSTSDGDGTEMSIFTEEEDLKCVFAQTKAMDFVDPEQIFLFGISQGGVVASLGAADLKDEVKAMVLCFPAYTLVDDARATYASIEEVPETVDLMGFTIGRFFYEKLFDLDILAEISGYKGDVLILHGTADDLVPYSSSEAAVEAFENAGLIPIEGAGHGFRDAYLEEAMVPITEFIKEHTN